MVEQRRQSPPTPQDFQITDSDVSHFEARKSRLDALAPKLCFAVAFAGVALVGLFQTDWKWMFSDGLLAPSTYAGLLMMLVGWLFGSMLVFFPAAIIVHPMISFALNRVPKADAVK